MSAQFANQQLMSNQPGRPTTQSPVLCASAGCGQKKHAAQWLFDYPRLEWFPMCERARQRLMHPPKLYRPGLSADDFTPLHQNDKVSDGGPLTSELKQDANPPFAAPTC